MPADSFRAGQLISEPTLFGFLFTFARISAVVAFLPLPGMKGTPNSARLTLALAFTVALWPVWSAQKLAGEFTLSRIVAGVSTELALGLAIGLVVGIVIEVFQASAQLISVQAGFAYASTIDPMSGADSPVLVTLAQLVAALMFVSSGADRALFRVLAESVAWNPPGAGTAAMGLAAGSAIYHFGSLILSAGLRLAAPITVLLLLADVLLAVFGRLQPQLQLLSLTFPVKLSTSMFLLALLVRFYPRFFENIFGQALRLIEGLASGGIGR